MSRQLRITLAVFAIALFLQITEGRAATLRDSCFVASSPRVRPSPKISFGYPERQNAIYESFELYVYEQVESIGSLFMVAINRYGSIGAKLVKYDLEEQWGDTIYLTEMVKRFLEMNRNVQFIVWPVEEGREGKVNQSEHTALEDAGLQLDQYVTQSDKKAMETNQMTWAVYVRKKKAQTRRR